MKIVKKEWLNWVIILIPFIFIAINWDKFPERIATHFGFDGKPDDYSSKVTGLILFPGINIGMYFLLLLIPRIDPRRKNYSMFEGKWNIIRSFLHIFLSFITLLTALIALGFAINVGNIVCYAVLALLMLMGNYMGNIRSNYFIGIRVPWTLENETVWNLTHRMAGILWVLASLLMMILLAIIPEAKWTIIPFTLIIVIIPIVYSYIKYKQIVVKNHGSSSEK